MPTVIHFRWLAALVLWLGPLLAAHATHILGGDISYTPIASTTAGVPRYHVVTHLFRDPTGVTQPTIQLACSRGGCNVSSPGSALLTVILSQTSTTYALGCPGAPGYLYQVLLFETDVDLPVGEWTLSVGEVNRAANIVNVVNSVNTSFYISTYLNNTLGQNSSPKFLSTLLPYLCNGAAQRYSFSSFESDGDSLRYEFRQPEQMIMANSYSSSGCSTPAVATFSPHFQLNPATGALTTIATSSLQQGVYAMAARVSEYRRVNGSWQLIGYVTRDISYIVVGSANQTPRFTSLRLNGAATAQPLGQPIRVQPGQTVTLGLDAADPDAGQALRFESQAPGIIPGLSLQTTGATTALLTWQVPASLPPGRYTATVAVLDNGCPNASEEYTFTFVVAPQLLAARSSHGIEAEAYPMPFREQVQFQTTTGGQLVTIIDNLGRVVAHLTAAADGQVRWQPAPTLPAGLYVARAADGQPLARLLRAE